MSTATPVITEATFCPVNEELARQWLARNTRNRPIRPKRVERFVRDMIAGHWQANGETIKFDTDGNLIDGQHRLWAVVEGSKEKPGLEIEFLVVENVVPEAMMTVDDVAVRNYGDYLGMTKQKGSSRVTNLAARITNWDQKPPILMPALRNRVTLTPSETHEWYSANKAAADDAIKYGALVAAKHKIAYQATIPGFFLMARHDHQTAVEFYANLRNWERIGKARHPILMLVSTINNRRNGKGGLPYDEALALLIMGWNALAEQRSTVGSYSLPRGGLTNSNFPQPIRPKWL